MSLDVSDRFIYESTVYSYERNRVYISDSAIYESDSLIEGLVESYFVTKNIEICNELIAAPLQYIEELKN